MLSKLACNRVAITLTIVTKVFQTMVCSTLFQFIISHVCWDISSLTFSCGGTVNTIPSYIYWPWAICGESWCIWSVRSYFSNVIIIAIQLTLHHYKAGKVAKLFSGEPWRSSLTDCYTFMNLLNGLHCDPIGRPVRATITLYHIGRPDKAIIITLQTC